jgi:hypothetical protein
MRTSPQCVMLVALAALSAGCASMPPRAGATPRIELTGGVTFPQLDQAEFPGFTGSIAGVIPATSKWGVALVADAEASYLLQSTVAGARLYGRTRPLFSGKRSVSYFGQLLLGSANGGVEGVLSSEGGFVLEPSVGLDYGAGARTFHLQVGYRHVEDGVVYDSRVPGAPIDQLSAPRIVLGMTWRLWPR